MTAARLVEKGLLVLFAVLGIVVMILAESLPYPLFRNLGGSPGVFPWVLGLLISSLSVIRLTTDTVKHFRGTTRESAIQEFETPVPHIIIGVSVAFTLLLPYIGFILSSTIWMTGILLLFKPEKKLLFVVVVVGLIALTYIAFWLYLPVPLPEGVLFERLF